MTTLILKKNCVCKVLHYIQSLYNCIIILGLHTEHLSKCHVLLLIQNSRQETTRNRKTSSVAAQWLTISPMSADLRVYRYILGKDVNKFGIEFKVAVLIECIVYRRVTYSGFQKRQELILKTMTLCLDFFSKRSTSLLL